MAGVIKRRTVLAALFAVVLLISLLIGIRQAKAQAAPCPPWGITGALNLLICDYGYGSLFEGLVGLLVNPGELPHDTSAGGGGARGFYDTDEPTEDVWVRWCYSNASEGIKGCKWGHDFEARNFVQLSSSGAQNEPIGFTTANIAPTVQRAILVTPPGTTEVVMLCAWYSHVEAAASVSSQSWVRYDIPAGATTSDGTNLTLLNQATGNSNTVTASRYITFTRGTAFPHLNPASHSDYSDYIAFGTAVRVQSFGGAGSAESYINCAVSSIHVGGETVEIGDTHTYFQETYFPQLPGFPWSSVEFTSTTIHTATVDFGMSPGADSPEEYDCLMLLSAVGPYTLTIPFQDTDRVIETPFFELCTFERTIDMAVESAGLYINIMGTFVIVMGLYMMGVIVQNMRS